MTLFGTIRRGIIVLDALAPLPDGTRVEVIVRIAEQKTPTLSQKLLRLAGAVTDLPADMAAQHDHYIHGTGER